MGTVKKAGKLMRFFKRTYSYCVKIKWIFSNWPFAALKPLEYLTTVPSSTPSDLLISLFTTFPPRRNFTSSKNISLHSLLKKKSWGHSDCCLSYWYTVPTSNRSSRKLLPLGAVQQAGCPKNSFFPSGKFCWLAAKPHKCSLLWEINLLTTATF